MGGVIGQCTSHNPGVGTPFEAEVLGQVLVFPEFQSRAGQPAHVRAGRAQGHVAAGEGARWCTWWAPA